MKIFDAIQQVTPCPVTRSTGCQCDRLERINEAEETIKAIAQLEHTVGDVQGAVKFKQKPGQPTIIKGIVKGLTPGKHGFHIHEFGDLSKGCESAGAHYNPDGVEHGSLQQGHVGDLGNIIADKSGTARFQIKAERVELSDVVGRAIVIHAEEDDLGKGGDEESLKTGNAGERVGCGVIRLKEVVEEEYKRKTSDKHFDRNQLPQIRRPDIQNSPFKYKEGSISITKLKPVQTQRVKGLSKKAQDIFLKNEDRPFIVDKNGYIINGHHRYDAANMLGIKKVPAIMIDADIEDVMNHFAHTTSDREVMPEHYFKTLYEKKLKEQEVTRGNFGGLIYPRLPHEEVLDAISSWEYGDTPIELSNGYVINAREEGYNDDDNAWVLLDPQGKMVDHGEGSIEDVMQDFTPILITEKYIGRNLNPEVADYVKGKKTKLIKVRVADLDDDAEDDRFGRVIDPDPDVGVDLDEPILIDIDGKTILDGFHRVYQAKRVGREFIPAEIIDENFPIPPTNDKLLQKIRDWKIRGYHGDRGTPGDSELFSMCDNYLLNPDNPMAGKLEVLQKLDLAMDIDSSETPTEKDVYDYIRGSGVNMPFIPPDIDENFADGKKKGKSRPGRVKRAGASCKGSVSDLRAKAKKYSGEKGKMYHWCANMKGGKKK